MFIKECLPELALPGVAAVFCFRALPNVGFFTGTIGFDITALSISSVITVKKNEINTV